MLKRIRNKIVREVNAVSVKIKKIRYRFIKPQSGSTDWLIKKEIQFGGLVTNVPRDHVSPHDQRITAELKFGGMTGGDRMYDNNYAPIYSRYLKSIGNENVKVVGEFGILKGTGLALWCDLFKKARVIGFDIDLNHFNRNKKALIKKCVFSENTPEICVFDQLQDGKTIIRDILKGQKFDIVVDDGLHTLDAIKKTFQSVNPYLSESFIYFIEDFNGELLLDENIFNGYAVHTYGLMTVVLPGISDVGQMK